MYRDNFDFSFKLNLSVVSTYILEQASLGHWKMSVLDFLRRWKVFGVRNVILYIKILSIDIGTNNEKLLKDPAYLGLKQPRMDSEEYYLFLDEFMAAIKLRYISFLPINFMSLNI